MPVVRWPLGGASSRARKEVNIQEARTHGRLISALGQTQTSNIAHWPWKERTHEYPKVAQRKVAAKVLWRMHGVA